jgi:nondiscriminating glutamyl-tRNA synthetase
MSSNRPAGVIATTALTPNRFTAGEVIAILDERGWLAGPAGDQSDALQAWCARAAELLGPLAADQAALAVLLQPVFAYDARVVLGNSANQDVLSRSGAREVIRELANRILDGGDIDSDRFKQIVAALKLAVPYRSRELFHPIRLVLTGRSGEGYLDRVILLLDPAARLRFAMPVKTNRQRILEFCAALE